MSSTWLDVPEAEGIDGYGDEGAEDYLEGMYEDGEAFAESDDDAESRYSRRRARARRLARARRRRRAALSRARYAGMPPGPPTTAAVVRKTEAEVANLEVESSVQADALRDALAAQRQQIRAGTNAAAASAVVPSLLSFLQTTTPDVGNNRYFKAGLPLAPLLLLRSTDRGLSDRRLWAIAAVAGLSVADDVKSRSQEVEALNIDRSVNELPQNAVAPFRAVAIDRRRRVISTPPGSLEWKSDDPRVVAVDQDGKVTAKGTAGGVATITATLKAPDGRVLDSDFVTVKVV